MKQLYALLIAGLCTYQTAQAKDYIKYKDASVRVSERVESTEILFKPNSESFMIWNNRMEKVLEPGSFQILTGGNSEDLQSTKIKFK